MAAAQRRKDCVNVKVAVNIRPLITTELLAGSTDCITLVPGEPQVQIRSHTYTYDCVYGSSGAPSSALFDECVSPLVDAIFHGYNASVIAYGQTGSGKSHTMGTDEPNRTMGIIQQVANAVFNKIDTIKDNTEFFVRVSFIEVFNDEVFDLLEPVRTSIQIRETVNGGIILPGVTEAEIKSKEEMQPFLSRGTKNRTTRSTNMNSQSSRSHAVFTILLEQRKTSDGILSAKLHLVDLAGSESVKITGAYGLRSKEGGNINKGLLALGQVISAFGDVKKRKRKEGDHIPYRDSKLTRLLQDSLGGNTKTLMIACISPSDTNAEETITTLKYASLARNIRNKAVVNRQVTTEMHSAQMLRTENDRLRSQVEQLQAELVRPGDGETSEELEERRRNKYKKRNLLALNERQKMVLQRKTDEATMATKRLKALLEAIKVSREISGPGNANPSGFKALMQAIEQELEVKVRVHEVRTEYERQMKERVAMEKEVTELKEEAEIDCPQTMSPSARNCRLSALQNMLEMLSSTLVSMASQLSEAKELECEFEGRGRRGRWNQVQSLTEAQNVMNHLFDLVSSSRCQLRDKDSENTKLKEKLAKHCSLVRKLTELHGQ